MVAVKAQEADRFVARPPADARFVLVYGPDGGLVAERTAKLVKSFRADNDDPFAFVQLDAATIASDPNRLIDEALTISLFGGRRTILVRDGGSRPAVANALQTLLKSPPEATAIVVEAGDLQKSSALRLLFERDRAAHAIPCYVDDDAALLRLVDEDLAAAGLAIKPDARHLLAGLLGGDRLISRGELAKLCLYAAGKGTVTVEDVEAVIADASAVSADEVVDAAATGELAMLGDRLSRAFADGITAGTLAGAALRHFQMLDKARAFVDGGTSASAVVEGLRPPVFFKRRDKVVKALQIWSAPRLARALAILSDAARETRLASRLEREIVGEALFTIARAAGRRS
jgi:DNA polymerase-3 subunit delta